MKEINILLELVEKVNSILGDGVLISKYQSLINTINANQIYNEIFADIANFNSENNINFPYIFQKKYSLQMGIGDYFGHKANEKLKFILDKGKGGVNDIQDIINTLNKIKSSFSVIYSNFTSLGLIKFESEKETYLELVFDGEFEINSLNDFNKNTKDIEKHIKNLSKLSEKIIDNPSIEYISKNSPVDIAIYLGEFASIYYIFDSVVQKILDRVIQVQEIRKAQLEIESKKMLNDKIREGFDEQIKALENDFSDKLSDELYSEYMPKAENGAENEIKKGVKEAINYFDKLIVNGGTVNIGILPPRNSEEGEQKEDFIYNDILDKNNKKEVLLNEVKKLKSGKDISSKEE